MNSIDAWGYRLMEPNAPLARETFTIDSVADDDVVVKVAGCGLCHTDISFYSGQVRPKQMPVILGHEISGTVVAAGANHAALDGKEVIIPAVLPCGDCDLCHSGRGNVCRAQKFPGNDFDGGFASHVTVPGRFLCELPDSLGGLELADLSVIADAVTTFYGADPSQSPDYARIVDERHHDRLMRLLDAGGYEATVIGGTGDRDLRYLAPTVLAGVKPDAAVMDDEIFGPILPVISVGDIDEAIRFVNDREKPLALYAFSQSHDVLDHVVANTSAGGVTLNHAMLHLAVPDLPFGGVGASGMGVYHGKSGFDTFTHYKPVLDKPTRPDPALMYPPYTNTKKKILRKFL